MLATTCNDLWCPLLLALCSVWSCTEHQTFRSKNRWSSPSSFSSVTYSCHSSSSNVHWCSFRRCLLFIQKQFFQYIRPMMLFTIVTLTCSIVLVGIGLVYMGEFGLFGSSVGLFWHQPISFVDSFIFSSIVSATDPISAVSVLRELHIEGQ